jgi:RNase P subunit RPR2
MKNKKPFVVSILVLVVAFASQSFSYVNQKPPKVLKNIKAFPSTMTYNEVDHQMDIFKVALGVKCNYCHAQTKESAPKLEIARDMIRMTRDLNEKYMVKLAHNDTEPLQTITCNTCHRGLAKPADKVVMEDHHAPFPSQSQGGAPQGTAPAPIKTK